jgi:hypothetical protein
MSTWIYAAAPEHGFNPDDVPPKLVLKDTAMSARFTASSPQEIAVALNAETVVVRSKVATWQAKTLLLQTGEWGGIVLLSRKTPPDGDAQQQTVVAAAITAIAALEQTSVFDLDDPDIYSQVALMLGAFVSAGVLSAGTRDKLLALADVVTPVWQPPVTAEMVSAALEIR